jgi:hypothetical protein
MAAFIRIAACIISVMMLLLFPAARFHSFQAHFRTPEVRRTTQRHTSVAYSHDDTCERAIVIRPLPISFVDSEPGQRITARNTVEKPFEAPRLRILSRLKFNPSGSSGPDPLLSA